MTYKGYRNIKKHAPPICTWLDVQYLVTGAGAPERQGWLTEGFLTESGAWRLKDRVSGFPTHWKEINYLK